MECYKARLVAKGYAQKNGMENNETFILVEKMISIHIILALLAIEYLKIHQMGVKTTFLNGDFF